MEESHTMQFLPASGELVLNPGEPNQTTMILGLKNTQTLKDIVREGLSMRTDAERKIGGAR